MYYQPAIREGLSLPQFSIRVMLHSYYEIWVRDTDGALYVVRHTQMPHVSPSIPENKKVLVSGEKKKQAVSLFFGSIHSYTSL